MLIIIIYFKMYSEKLEKHLWRGLLGESPFTRNMTKVLFTVLKYKKAPMANLKKNLRFKQLRWNYINSQKKQTEKERLRLVISLIRVGVIVKTDDEVYVSSTIKMYSYFSFVFSTVPKKVQLLKISKVM